MSRIISEPEAQEFFQILHEGGFSAEDNRVNNLKSSGELHLGDLEVLVDQLEPTTEVRRKLYCLLYSADPIEFDYLENDDIELGNIEFEALKEYMQKKKLGYNLVSLIYPIQKVKDLTPDLAKELICVYFETSPDSYRSTFEGFVRELAEAQDILKRNHEISVEFSPLDLQRIFIGILRKFKEKLAGYPERDQEQQQQVELLESLS